MLDIMNKTLGQLGKERILTLKDQTEHNEISKEVLKFLAKYELNIADILAVFNCAMIHLIHVPVNTLQAVDDNR